MTAVTLIRRTHFPSITLIIEERERLVHFISGNCSQETPFLSEFLYLLFSWKKRSSRTFQFDFTRRILNKHPRWRQQLCCIGRLRSKYYGRFAIRATSVPDLRCWIKADFMTFSFVSCALKDVPYPTSLKQFFFHIKSSNSSASFSSVFSLPELKALYSSPGFPSHFYLTGCPIYQFRHRPSPLPLQKLAQTR